MVLPLLLNFFFVELRSKKDYQTTLLYFKDRRTESLLCTFRDLDILYHRCPQVAAKPTEATFPVGEEESDCI